MRWRGFALLAGGLLLSPAGGRASSPGEQPGGAGGKEGYPSFQGRVIETFDVGRYTYLRVETPDETIWAAAPGREIRVGRPVRLGDCAPMADFHSTHLQRTFELIYFCSSLRAEEPEASRAPPTN